MKKFVGMMVLLALVVAATALQGGTAAAQATPETSRIAVNQCRPTRGGILCTQAEGLIHRTTTPAGDMVVTTNLNQCIQVTSLAGQLLASRCERIHRNELVKQGQPEVIHTTSRGVRTFEGLTCEFDSALQIVMGEVRHVDLEERCSAA
jgi:hypothetical protein